MEKLTQEQTDLIIKGERPEGMPYELFKIYRAEVKKLLKNRLDGEMFHLSSWVECSRYPHTDKYFTRHTKTYIKSENDSNM